MDSLEYFKGLLKELEDNLKNEKDSMSESDIRFDEGYINALKMIIGKMEEK